MNKRIVGFYIALLSFCLIADINSQEVVNIKRLKEPVEFDGKPFEGAWEGLDVFPMKMNRPVYGNDPSETTEVMMTYDDEFLWFGARMYMSDTKEIFVNTKKRDASVFNVDAFSVVLDTYNDNENALEFSTTPTGLRTDIAISNDASGGGGWGGGGSINFSWNTFWDVKTSTDDKGWYLEMRIPFSSLKFKPQDDKVVMGVILKRGIGYNNEMDTWPFIDPKHGMMGPSKPSLAGKVEFEGIRPSKPVYVSPYVIGGFSRDWKLNDAETEYVKNDNPDYNAGLDIKYNINSNLTLDLTANTDFAQVEADDQQVNLTRYSLYFPEKRMFFMERSSLFSFNLGGRSDLFYSRRIGISNGEHIRIYGGARLVGRMGKWDVGVLDMQTEKHEETFSENFGVIRMRRQVINPNSFFGGIFTSKLGMDGEQNFAYGLDGIFRLFGDDYLNVKAAQSYDSKIDSKIASVDPAFFLINWERRSEKGFAYSFNYSYAGQKFNPGIGFVQRPGISGFEGQLMYGFIPGEESKVMNGAVTVDAQRYTRLEDRKLESFNISTGFDIASKTDYFIRLSLNYQEEGVIRRFPLSDSVWIEPDSYSFVTVNSFFNMPESRMLTFGVNTNYGGFYDGRKLTVGVEPTLNVSSSLQLSGSYEFNAIRFPNREKFKNLNIHIAGLKALYMLSTKISASLFVQYVNTDDEFITNLRLRYNPREGNDFYLVINEYRGFDNRHEFIESPPYFNRTILLKYTHTFIF